MDDSVLFEISREYLLDKTVSSGYKADQLNYFIAKTVEEFLNGRKISKKVLDFETYEVEKVNPTITIIKLTPVADYERYEIKITMN